MTIITGERNGLKKSKINYTENDVSVHEVELVIWIMALLMMFNSKSPIWKNKLYTTILTHRKTFEADDVSSCLFYALIIQF